MLGQKGGHKVKLKENIVNTLEAAIFRVRMFVLKMSRSSSNMGHIGSEIEGKFC